MAETLRNIDESPLVDVLDKAYQLGYHKVKDGCLVPVLEELEQLFNQELKSESIYIDGIAYELASYGEPYSDGSRQATIRRVK